MNCFFLVVICFVVIKSYVYLDVKRDCGAKGDGKSSDSVAIRGCFSKCESSGGCTMNFPNGKYLTSQFTVPSNCRWLFESSKTEILFYNDYDKWPVVGKQYTDLIQMTSVKNFTWIGNGGTVDGNGERWWDAWLDGKLKAGRPYLVHFQSSSQIYIDGVKFQNSPMFHVKFDGCSDIEISNVNVYAPFFDKSRNTDGIDPSSSTNIHIHHTTISTGDDCIALKGGTSNVLVENCHFGTGHGTSLGSLERDEFVKDVIFRDNTYSGTENGMRIKAWENWTGYVRNITWEKSTMKDVKNTIVIDMTYSDEENNKKDGDNSNSGGGIESVLFDSIRSEGSEVAGTFKCRKNDPCKEIKMKDVDISAKHGFSCEYAYGSSDNVKPSSCLKKN